MKSAVFVFSVFLGSLASSARADVLSELTITFPRGGFITGGTLLDFERFGAGLAMYEPRPLPMPPVLVGRLFYDVPFPASEIGTAEHTATAANDPQFSTIASQLTDGSRDLLGLHHVIYRVGGGPAVIDQVVSSQYHDFLLRHAGVPPPPSDLSGYQITSITRRVEVLDVSPINDGFGAQLGPINLYFRFEGRVPEPTVAMMLPALAMLTRRVSRRSQI